MIKQTLRKIVLKSNRFSGLVLAARDHQKTQTPLVDTVHGFRLAGSSSMANGSFERDETRLVQELLPLCDVFVNVGANIGYYCCFAAKAGLPVIAFEPHPVNSRLLLKNLQGNNFQSRSEVYPVAVGGENGILSLFGSGTAASLVEGWAGIPSESSMLVPVITLDGVLDGRYRDKRILILTDVEGAELHVIKGARNTMCRDPKPWWIIEICITEHQPAGAKLNPNLVSTFEAIFQAGYAIWTFTGSPRKIELTEVMDIAATGNDSIGVHNFLCVDPLDEKVALNALTGR